MGSPCLLYRPEQRIGETMSGIVNSTGARSGVIGTITAVAGSLGLTTAVGSITAANSLTSAVDQSLSFTPTSVIFFYSTENLKFF